ncbi:unnamed protein product [Mytilus edulis]|uniref:RNase H type-1 domain-containing protein n=1 Tax=Mytilus edulis TaxID=6550 RepID=A0A8S3RA32_MYTED|nr:unnamed protein product [Mytilus edulis]
MQYKILNFLLQSKRRGITLNWTPNSYISVIRKIKENIEHLRQKGLNVIISWTPGHANISGNDEADILSKTAAEEAKELPPENNVTTLQDVKQAAYKSTGYRRNVHVHTYIQEINGIEDWKYLRETGTFMKKYQLRNTQLCMISQLKDISVFSPNSELAIHNSTTTRTEFSTDEVHFVKNEHETTTWLKMQKMYKADQHQNGITPTRPEKINKSMFFSRFSV